MFLCGNLAIGQFELFLCGNWVMVYFLPQPIFSVDFLTFFFFLFFLFFFILVICFCVETELLVNLNCFCVETELWFWICLVETEWGGVISLLPDNLNEIGVENVEVSYQLASWILSFFFLFFFSFFFTDMGQVFNIWLLYIYVSFHRYNLIFCNIFFFGIFCC